ncbi:MAG: oligosaccharide flippase family protein [Phycisphaerae bacterium]|nr:oligosaccharide flippase family protein [Phycisphaerae bacterium]
MHQPLSLRKNFSWSLFGNIAGSGFRWLILMIIAKMTDTEHAGYYTLALSITGPIIMFTMLQLRAAYVTDVCEEYPYGYYIGVRLFTNVLAALVLGGVLLFMKGRYEAIVYGVIFVVFLNKAIESTADIFYGVMQKHDRLDKVAISTMLRQGGGALVLFAALWLTGSLLCGVIAIGFCWLAVLFFYDCKNAEVFEKCQPLFEPRAYKMIILTGIPLGITRGLIALDESIPRYFVEGYLGTSEQGIFSAMAYVITAAYLFVEALGYSVAARLARYYNYNQKIYIRVLLKVTAIAFLMGFGCVLVALAAGRQLLTILYSPEYAKYPDVFVWLMVLATGKMISSMLNHGMNATRYFKSQVPLNVFSVLITAGCCMPLVPLYGLKGAVWAMLGGVIVKIAGSIFVIQHALKHNSVLIEKGNPGSL